MRIPDDNRDFSSIYGGAPSPEYMDKQEHADEFLCKKCREWTSYWAESILDGTCENCYIEFYDDDKEYEPIYNEPTKRREMPKSKYAIDLDKIKKDVTTHKTNRNRKGEPR